MAHTKRHILAAAPWTLALGSAALVGGCSSGGSYVPPPIVAAPPAPPPPPASEPDAPPSQRPGESPTGGAGPGGTGSGSTPYTGSMTVEELLVRSAMAYGELEAYADQGTITIDQPGRRTEYGFTTIAVPDSDFSFMLQGPATSRLPNFQVHRAGVRFETIRSGSYGQAPTLEAAIQPLQDEMTVFTTSVPRILAGNNWGPTNDYDTARIVGVTTVNGQPTIMLEVELVGQGAATVWLDQATLLIRRLSHESPTSESLVTVAFNRLETR